MIHLITTLPSISLEIKSYRQMFGLFEMFFPASSPAVDCGQSQKEADLIYFPERGKRVVWVCSVFCIISDIPILGFQTFISTFGTTSNWKRKKLYLRLPTCHLGVEIYKWNHNRWHLNPFQPNSLSYLSHRFSNSYTFLQPQIDSSSFCVSTILFLVLAPLLPSSGGLDLGGIINNNKPDIEILKHFQMSRLWLVLAENSRGQGLSPDLSLIYTTALTL